MTAVGEPGVARALRTLACVLLLGCAREPAGEPVAATAFWADLGPAAPALPAAFGLPDAAASPLWSAPPVDRQPGQGTGELGYFAVGNGSMFGLLGVGAPANRLHGLVGPDYDKAGDAFWPDVGLEVVRGGEVLAAVDEAVLRIEGSALVATRLEVDGLALWTLDVAPWTAAWPTPADEAPALAHRWVVRHLWVEDLGGAAGATVRTVTGAPFEERDGWLARDDVGRTLWVGERGDAVGAVGEGAWAAAAEGLTGAPVRLLVGATYEGEARDDLPSPPDDVTARSLAAWRAWSAEGVQLDGPSRLTALLDANRVAVRAQLSARGAACPMSFYTRLWNRDLIGPVRLFSALGLHDDVAAMLDYHEVAARDAGDLNNSYRGALDPRAASPAPDWEADRSVRSGRGAAEGPTYTPLAYVTRWRTTGLTARAEARFGLLLRAMRGQRITEQGLMPFSGDETFRPQMASSMGLSLTFPFEEETWSANSAILWVAGAEQLAELAEAVGRDDVVDELLDGAAALRAATEATYRRDDGTLRPFVYQDDREPPTSSYPDVSMKAAWAGYLDPLDPDHLALVDATTTELWAPEGLLLTPLHPANRELDSLGIRRGILAGMSPGYGLWTLARTFRPEVAEAARFLADAVDPGGTWPEVLVADDTRALTPFYTASGFTETWARYRPWEGGIDMEALLVAALGLEVDARVGALRVAPTLPELGPLQATGVRVGDVGAEVAFTPGTAWHEATVRADGAITVTLEGCGDAPALEVGGEAVEVTPAADHDGIAVWRATLPVEGEIVARWAAGCP